LDSTSPFPAAAAATSFGVRVIFESPTSSMYPPSLRLVIAFSKRSGPENHDTRYLRHGIMATRMRGVLRALMGRYASRIARSFSSLITGFMVDGKEGG